MPESTNIDRVRVWSRIGRLVRRHWKNLLAALILLAILTALGLIGIKAIF
jgi:hypothetical protein